MSLARKPDPPNTLYYGDNLDILRRYIDDESIDLIYLDPPFNSNADYNVLFAEKDGTQAHAQIKAFEDTWTWDLEAARDPVEWGIAHQHSFLGVPFNDRITSAIYLAKCGSN